MYSICLFLNTTKNSKIMPVTFLPSEISLKIFSIFSECDSVRFDFVRLRSIKFDYKRVRLCSIAYPGSIVLYTPSPKALKKNHTTLEPNYLINLGLGQTLY